MENSKENRLKNVSPRFENIVKGIFLIFFALILTLNVGKVGRTLSFLPVYLFGASYYLVAESILFFGLYRLIKGRKFKFGHKTYVIGAILILFAFTFFLSYISSKNSGSYLEHLSFGEVLGTYNSELSTYYSEKGIYNVFYPSIRSCGLIGVFCGGLTNNDAITLFLGVVIMFLGVMCFVGRLLLLRSKKKRKGVKIQIKKEDLGLEEEYQEPEIIEQIDNPAPVFDLVEEKESLPEPVEVKPGYESDDRPLINQNSGFAQVAPSLDNSFNAKPINHIHNEYSEFTPLSFNNNSPFSQFGQPSISPIENKVEPQPSTNVEEPLVEEEEEVNLIESRPVVEEIVEEENKEEHVINESLVTAQPIFQERVEVAADSAPVPEVNVTPAPEVKKPRQRVVWIPPSTDILATYETQDAQELNEKVASERMIVINKTLSDFKIGARCIGYKIGPSVTRYNIEYDPNVTLKSVERIEQDISLRLGGVTSRFAAIIPGEPYSGFEVPNAAITTVSFKDVVTALPEAKKKPMMVAFGKDISGNVIYADYTEFPHLLVAGTTGSGKSIYVHSIISTLIMRMSPDDLRIVLVDPKKVEMTKYREMPHLLCPIISEAEKAKVCLQKLVEEMERRYELFSTNPEISGIKDYNEWAKENKEETLPYILCILDEYADLVDNCKEISQPVVSIAQKARSAGIHLLISTQRPSTNVITGVIKGNLPTHVALTTASYTDSMTIIGEGGAEKLLGKGDMLVQSPLVSRSGVVRLQGCYIQNKEIVHIVNYLKEHYETHYDENYLDLVDHSKEPVQNVLAPGEVEKESSIEEENKYQSIKEWVMTQEFVSMSKIQRECSVGFNRAGRFFSRLQKEGVVALTQDGSSKGCRVLVHDKYYDGDDIVTSDELIG